MRRSSRSAPPVEADAEQAIERIGLITEADAHRYAPARRNAGFRLLVRVPQCVAIVVEDDPFVRIRVTELGAREVLIRALRLESSVCDGSSPNCFR